jgi:hypothetical protein
MSRDFPKNSHAAKKTTVTEKRPPADIATAREEAGTTATERRPNVRKLDCTVNSLSKHMFINS